MRNRANRKELIVAVATLALITIAEKPALAGWPGGASLAGPLADETHRGMAPDVIRTRGFRIRSRGGHSSSHASSRPRYRHARAGHSGGDSGRRGSWRARRGNVVRVVDLPDVPGLHWRGGIYKDIGYLFAGSRSGWVAYVGEGRYLPITSRELGAMLRVVGMSAPPPVPARPTRAGHGQTPAAPAMKDDAQPARQGVDPTEEVEAAAPPQSGEDAPRPTAETVPHRSGDDGAARPDDAGYREMPLHPAPRRGERREGVEHDAALSLRGSIGGAGKAARRPAADMITTGTVAPVSSGMGGGSPFSGGALTFLLLGLATAAAAPFVARHLRRNDGPRARDLLARLHPGTGASAIGGGDAASEGAWRPAAKPFATMAARQPASASPSAAAPRATFGRRPVPGGPRPGSLAAARLAYMRGQA